MPTHDLRVERSERDASSLKLARGHLASRLRWWALSGFAGLGSLGIGALSSVLGWAAIPGAFGGLLVSGALGASAILAWLRGRQHRFLAASQIETAWLQVAEDAVASFKQVDVDQLAGLLGTDAVRADALLHQLVGEERVASVLTGEGRVVYSKPRVRVAASDLVRARVDTPASDHLDELELDTDAADRLNAARHRV